MFKVSLNCHKQLAWLPRASAWRLCVPFAILAKLIEAKQQVAAKKSVFSIGSKWQLCGSYALFIFEQDCSCYAAWTPRPVLLSLLFSPSLQPDSTSFLTSHGFLLQALSQQKTWHSIGCVTWNALLHSINGNLLLFAFFPQNNHLQRSLSYFLLIPRFL